MLTSGVVGRSGPGEESSLEQLGPDIPGRDRASIGQLSSGNN